MSSERAPVIQPDDNLPTLTLPHSVIEEGYREVVRVWVKETPGTRKKSIACTVRTVFQNFDGWADTLVTLARNIVQDFRDPNGTETKDDLDAMAFGLLMQAAETIPANAQIEELRDEMEGPIQPIHEVEVNTGAANHPGLIEIPLSVLQDSEWRQLISVWYLAEVQDCEGCGNDHDEQTIISGSEAPLSAEKFGELLATLAKAHAEGTTKSETERLKFRGVVEKSFYESMSRGLSKA
jgi:hypothetical protein